MPRSRAGKWFLLSYAVEVLTLVLGCVSQPSWNREPGMDHHKQINKQRWRRRMRVRGSLEGTAARPRLSVFRSSKHIYAQLIDDQLGVTLAAASTATKEFKAALAYGGNNKAAEVVGKQLAEAATAKGISMAAFDRGHYRYHGRVKALADAARAAGLQF